MNNLISVFDIVVVCVRTMSFVDFSESALVGKVYVPELVRVERDGSTYRKMSCFLFLSYKRPNCCGQFIFYILLFDFSGGRFQSQSGAPSYEQ